MNKSTRLMLLLLVFYLFAPASMAVEVRVIALFTNKALLQIEGEQKLLSKGETFKGVTLESASGRGAVVIIDGKSQKLGLNQSIQGSFKKRQVRIKKIYPELQGMYYVNGKINGKPTRFLVDTGATFVTMSGRHASQIGIDFKKGERGYANTAAATVPVWKITLDSVMVGGIRVVNVAAMVIEGSNPREALLGNSFLRHTELERSGIVMKLQQKY
ncbi:MAG: retropepsin-like aspartic protease [Gammaproteobacteria bacterium]|nr:retropepsin-like aspartic protease [Gammaproteobacteria bacterium]